MSRCQTVRGLAPSARAATMPTRRAVSVPQSTSVWFVPGFLDAFGCGKDERGGKGAATGKSGVDGRDRSHCACGEWSILEGSSLFVVTVPEARLEPSDLTQPDSGQYSLPGMPFHEGVDCRQSSECSGIESPLVGLITGRAVPAAKADAVNQSGGAVVLACLNSLGGCLSRPRESAGQGSSLCNIVPNYYLWYC